MKRTTIMLPATLKRKAEAHAKRRHLSLGGYIRQSLEQSIRHDANGHDKSHDPLFNTDIVFEDNGPPDLAENHDKYLEQILMEEHDRKGRDLKMRRR